MSPLQHIQNLFCCCLPKSENNQDVMIEVLDTIRKDAVAEIVIDRKTNNSPSSDNERAALDNWNKTHFGD